MSCLTTLPATGHGTVCKISLRSSTPELIVYLGNKYGELHYRLGTLLVYSRGNEPVNALNTHRIIVRVACLRYGMSGSGKVIFPARCVGPDYRPEEEKPTATVSTQIAHENVHILPQTPQLIALLTYVTHFRQTP